MSWQILVLALVEFSRSKSRNPSFASISNLLNICPSLVYFECILLYFLLIWIVEGQEMEWNETPLIVRSQREVLMVLDPAEFWGITQEEEAGRPR